MNADQLPLNQSTVIANTDFFRAPVTRISAGDVEIVYHDQQTNDETLKVLGKVDGSSSELVSFDNVYWNVIVNNRPATTADLHDLLNKSGLGIAIDPSKRTISVMMSPTCSS